jgi:hypothetical protein
VKVPPGIRISRPAVALSIYAGGVPPPPEEARTKIGRIEELSLLPQEGKIRERAKIAKIAKQLLRVSLRKTEDGRRKTEDGRRKTEDAF